MISRIHSNAVVVSDQEAALKFYTEILGWENALEAQMGENYPISHRGARWRGDGACARAG